MSKINQNDIWCIIKSMLDSDKKKYLIKHHIDSFNDFIDNKIPNTILKVSPLSIFHDYDPAMNHYKYEISINFINSYYTKPYISENDGSVKPLFPYDARMRNFTYSSTLYVDIEISVWKNPTQEDRTKLSFKEISLHN